MRVRSIIIVFLGAAPLLAGDSRDFWAFRHLVRPAPPAPEEVNAFVAEPAAGAYRDLIERLLASPHHGERWGRQWLDVAGYSDSNGYHRNDTPRPLAYHYRDYVIKSFNEDKPYDSFLLEQLAPSTANDSKPPTAPIVEGGKSSLCPQHEMTQARR